MKKQNYFKTIFLLLLFSIKLTAQVPPYVPTNGLVGWWPFTGNANDLSGNGNNGTVNGATATVDRFSNVGQAYNFDGVNDRISINHNASFNFTNNLTVSIWSKVSNFGPNNQWLIDKGLDASPGLYNWGIASIAPGNFVSLAVTNTGDYTSTSAAASNTGIWYMWTYVYDGAFIKLYKNGSIVINTPANGNLITNTQPISVGYFPHANMPPYGYFYNGQLDDIGIWNRALTICEINQLYTASTISVVASNSLICAGQNATISASGANSYTWSNSSNSSSIVVSPSLTMVYSVAGTNSAGCTSTSAINLTVNPIPTVNAGADQTVFFGNQVTLSGSGATSYTWSNGVTNGAPFTANISNTYTLTGSSNGCSATDQVIVTVMSQPTISASNTSICAGQSATLNAAAYNNTILCANAGLPGNLNNGLLGYWPFCGNANDASGNGYNGSVNGASLTSDRFGNTNRAYSFNGTSNSILAGVLNIPNNFTASFWYLADATINLSSSSADNNSGATMLSKGASNSPCNYADFAFGFKNGNYGGPQQNCLNNSWFETELGVGCNYSYASNCNPNIALTYNWKHIAIVLRASYLKRYSNGVLLDSIYYNANGGNLANSGYPLSIGARYVANYGTVGFWKGKLDDIGIWNRALTNQEITNLNNLGSASYSWSPGGATTASISVSPTITTTYTCNITYNGASTTQTQVITVNANPTITVNSGAICAGQNFTINPNGANTYTIQGGNVVVSPAGNTSYTVAGTSTAGCLSQAFATSSLIVNPNPTITVNNGAICAGQNFTINPNGANTYTIQGGNAVVSPAGNTSYTVAGTSTAGCLSQAFATSSLIVNANPSITVNSGAICAGQNFTINPNGANTYTIQGGNAVVSPAGNTSYTVAGTSTAGCLSQAFATSNLTVNANPSITVNSGAICAGQNFTINPNGANTYTIQGGNAVVSPAGNSSYTVAGTSTAGCLSQAFATSNLTVNANPSITVNSGAICAGQNFTINPNGANTYTIQGGNAVVSPAGNTSYTVAGTSTAGCLSQAFATSSLIVNANPSITVNNGAICAGQNFTINPNGANTYTIQGGNAVVSPAGNTSYTVAGTSTAGCLSQAFATSSLIVNANPSITVNSGAICAGQIFTINPNGANTYTIQGGNAVVSPPSNSSYTVIGTSTAGCLSQAFATSNLIVNANPSITVNNGTICAGQNFTINPNGANTYTIQGGNAVVSPAGNTSYTVAGTSTAGCLSQAFATSNLIVNANPSITVNNGTICAGQNFTINPNGANTYTIQGGNAVVSPAGNTSYTVAGTSTAGCLSQAFATSNLTVNANPIITVNSGAICAGQNFTINPNGANTYTIQGGNAVVSPPSNTSYTVAGTSTAGCLSQAFATSSLIVNANPSITVNSGAICAGQNFTINPNGANTYTIQGGNAVVSPPSNTSYTVAGTSTAGCLSQAFATSNLTVNANPIITVNSGAICAGQNFTINSNGANTYTIQGGSAVVSPTSNASFTVSGTSTAGCLSQAFATSNLTVNPNPTITVNNGTICAGQNFTINPNGANTYTIQGGNAVVSPSINTSYTVAGTSTAGCLSQAFATSSLIVNPNPTVTVNSGAICIGESFTISPNGANTYTIQGANAIVSPSINTTYTVAGTSTAGCVSQAVASISLIVNPLPILSISSTATVICLGEGIILTANGANTYTWTGGINTNSIAVSPSVSTTYSASGTSTDGCVGSNTLQLNVTECTNIKTIVFKASIKVYPNPNKGEFTIELTNINNSNITITNVLGQIIKTQKAELINQINLNLFDKGIYFINVMENNQSVYKGSIIKE